MREKNEVNYTTPRLSVAPSSPHLLCVTTTAGGSTCAAALRSLHRAHRQQFVGMSAGGSEGTADRPAGRQTTTITVFTECNSAGYFLSVTGASGAFCFLSSLAEKSK